MLKKFFALALMLVMLIFVGNAEAGTITTTYLPLQCYVDHQVNTYSNPGSSKAGYISANVDLIQVTQIRNDGWVYGSYPGRNGRVARWFRMSDLCADTNYSNRFAYVSGAQRVFRTNGRGDTIGSVSNNEPVIVIADNGNRAQIIYRLDNGTGYKLGWIPSSAVAGGNQRGGAQPTNNINHDPKGTVEQVNSPSPGVLHVRGKAYDLDNARGSIRLHVYVGGGAGSGSPNYEIRTDGSSNIFDDTRQVSRTGNQRVHIYALNDYGSGENKEIWNGVVNIKGNTPGGILFPLKGSITTSSNVKTKGYNCDYRAPSGTPVYAPADGTVNFRQSYAVNYNKLASYGNNFVFTSSDGQYKVTCAHLSSFNGVNLRYNQSLSYPCSSSKYRCSTISLGTRNVRKGDLIGYTGMTGNASGPHIHIEVTKNGSPVDPKAVFTTW